MKIIFKTTQLIEKIKNLAPTAEAKQTLIILGNLKFSLNEGVATITASDLEIEVTSTVPCEFDEGGTFTLPGKKFLEICNALSSHDQITVTIRADKADITAGKSKVSLPTLNAEDFPLMTYESKEEKTKISASELGNIISKTSFAMAYQDARHFLNGLHICNDNGKLTSVCTDGHRLAKYTSNVNISEDLSIIVPRKAIMEINRILASFNDSKELLIEFNTTNNNFIIQIADYLLISKLIEGNYPNFNKVIPESTKSKISINKLTLKNSLNIISKVVNQQYKGVKLTPSNSSLHLISSNTESEVGEDQIDAKYDGEELSIGFNISYIQDVIDALESETLSICLNDQNSGCILMGDNDGSSVFVIMPMRV